MLILELLRTDIAERGVQSAGVVDLIDEAWKVGSDVLEGLIGHGIDGLDLQRLHEALGLGVVGWSPLGGGMLTGKYRKGEKGRAEGFGGKVFQAENSDQRSSILDAVIAIADDVGVTPGEIAIAWVAAKGVLPIIGPRTLQQLEGNLAATKIRLSAEQVRRLDTVSAPPQIFPYTLLDDPENRDRIFGGKLDRFDPPATPVA